MSRFDGSLARALDFEELPAPGTGDGRTHCNDQLRRRSPHEQQGDGTDRPEHVPFPRPSLASPVVEQAQAVYWLAGSGRATGPSPAPSLSEPSRR